MMKENHTSESDEKQCVLRLTEIQHQRLFHHLFSGDGKESVAVALCGRHASQYRDVITVHEITTIPNEECSFRSDERVEWSTERIMPILSRAAKYGMAILKIHSHPTGYPDFSEIDNHSDTELFSSVAGWLDDDLPHASAIMLPNGQIFGRFVFEEGEFFPIQLVSVCGSELKFWLSESCSGNIPAFAQRHAQAFGAGTTSKLQQLSIAVVGASGTGSPVIQTLARLGVGRLVIVDPDVIEEKNLNRIIGSTYDDAIAKRSKVEVFAREIERIGLGMEVTPLALDLSSTDAIKEVAACDIVIGCMDGVVGRDILNRIATYYSIPYFDVGIRLDADGKGGIDQICGSVHYLQPGKSSLLSRGVYTASQVHAAGLKRTDPEEYKKLVKEKYIFGVEEDRPAVVSINLFFASMLVNELLARLHPYRDDDNEEFASFGASLTQSRFLYEKEGEVCPVLSGKVGRGHAIPLLGLPMLSNESQA
jgi:proteasome lid subunit RPN8/RPN11